MRDVRLAVLAAALLAAACGRDVPEAREDAVLPPEPPEVVAVTAVPVTYSCARGQTLQAVYPDAATAVVAYAGRTFTLKRVPEQSGARYVGEGREWRLSGADGSSDGTLRETQADSALAGTLIAECSTVGGVQTQP